MTNPTLCKTCRKPKATFECGLCHECSCKSCTEFTDENTFSFLTKVSDELKHTNYCIACFNEKVRDPLNEYNDTMEKAKEIIIYSKEQSKLTRFLKRKEDPLKVENCEDEQEALLRMSFFAVQAKFNCLIDVILTTKKIVIGSHKKTMYSATGVPINIDPNEIRGHLDPP